LILAAGLFLFAEVASAVDLNVNCPTDSLQAAIDSLDAVGPHTITVTGTCAERLRVFSRDRLSIRAPAGETATIASDLPFDGIVLDIANSRGIELRRLVIRRGFIGMRLRRSSEVSIQGCTVEENASSGIQITENSTAAFGGTVSDQFVTVRNNGEAGIRAERSVVSINGGVTIENNVGSGLAFTSGVQGRVNGPANAPNIIQGNVAGVLVNFSSSAFFTGQNNIKNNQGSGVQVAAGSGAAFFGSAGGVTVIEGNSRAGLFVAFSSSAILSGPHKIRNNGGSGEESDSGVRVFHTSSVQLAAGVEVSNNSGAGILAEPTGSISLENVSVANNSKTGVDLRRMSVAVLFPGNTMAGNGVANLACDTTSLLAGDPGNLTNIQCSRIEREQGPPRRGPILP
jgi:hypothetical protein